MARAGLSTDRVVAEAARLADERGLDQLTLAALAGELGVRVPSLYKHVDGLPRLRRHLSVHAKNEVAAVLGSAAVGRSRGDALRSLTAAYLAWAAKHPGQATAVQVAPDPDDAEEVAASTAVTDVLFAVISGYGVGHDTVVDATRVLRAGLQGFASLQALGGFKMARPVEDSVAWWLDGLDRLLTDQGTPQL